MARVLLDDYSHAECMAMLPKAPSAASNVRAIRIAKIKKGLPTAPPGVRPGLLAELAALTLDVGIDTKARRLDLLIETFDGKVAFVDNFTMSTRWFGQLRQEIRHSGQQGARHGCQEPASGREHSWAQRADGQEDHGV